MYLEERESVKKKLKKKQKSTSRKIKCTREIWWVLPGQANVVIVSYFKGYYTPFGA